MLLSLQGLIDWDKSVTLALNGSDFTFIDNAIMAITSTITWIPLAIVLIYVLIRNNNMPTLSLLILFLALCVLCSDQMSSSFTKPYFERFRPSRDPEIMYLVDIVDDYRGGKYGFFSSHAANTFSITVFLSLLFRYRAMTIGLFSWTLLNCYSRIYLGVHYVGDVIVGILWGAIVGGLMFFAYKRIGLTHSNANSTVAGELTASGYQVKSINLLLLSLLLTYLCVIIYATLVSV